LLIREVIGERPVSHKTQTLLMVSSRVTLFAVISGAFSEGPV